MSGAIFGGEEECFKVYSRAIMYRQLVPIHVESPLKDVLTALSNLHCLRFKLPIWVLGIFIECHANSVTRFDATVRTT